MLPSPYPEASAFLVVPRASWGGGGSFHTLDWVPALCSLPRGDAWEGKVCVCACVHCLGVYLCARVFAGIWVHAFVGMRVYEYLCVCVFLLLLGLRLT